jgi:hypothetical protein
MKIPGSFRDPSGFVFSDEGTVYRAVNVVYRDHFDHLITSGLYKKLSSQGLLISHEECSLPQLKFENLYKILKPRQIRFFSYPYEWCFAQLKDASLATLKIQRIALDHGMVLKDATGFNIQFVDGKPCLIDTLSFHLYEAGKPWIAYRQFCETLLAPLALASAKGHHWIRFLQIFLNGIPLRIPHKSLPFSSRFKFGLALHIHLQAKSIEKVIKSSQPTQRKPLNFRKESFYGLIASLEQTIKSLPEPKPDFGWQEYYQSKDYLGYFEAKKLLVAQFLKEADARYVWDLGANDGAFSKLAAQTGAEVISLDSDHTCVSNNYKASSKEGVKNILPLVLDITNPTASAGWNTTERSSFIERGPADLVLALALIHHLAIANNVPLDDIASFFAQISKKLIIEFVPKSDRRVQELLANREDIFIRYRKEEFESAFKKYFQIVRSSEISGSGRILYLLNKK